MGLRPRPAAAAAIGLASVLVAGCAGGGGAMVALPRETNPPGPIGPVVAVWPGSDGRRYAVHGDVGGRPTHARPVGWPPRASPIAPVAAVGERSTSLHVVLEPGPGQAPYVCPRFPSEPAGEAFGEPAEEVLAEYGVPAFGPGGRSAPFIAAWFSVRPGTREVDLRVLLPATIARPDRMRFDLAGESILIPDAGGAIGAVLERLVGRPTELAAWFRALGGGRAVFVTAEGVVIVGTDGTWRFLAHRATDPDR